MAIVNLNFSSAELAESIGKSIPFLMKKLAPVGDGPLYIVGNGMDFDEFCAPAIELLRPTAVACLWPTLIRSRVLQDTIDVFIVGEYFEPAPDNPRIVMFQSVIGAAEGVIAAVSRVVHEKRPKIIDICACMASVSAMKKVKIHFEAQKIAVRTILLEEMPTDGDDLAFELAAFDLLDDRPDKRIRNMPEWVLSKLSGPDFDLTPDDDPEDPGPDGGTPPPAPLPRRVSPTPMDAGKREVEGNNNLGGPTLGRGW